MNNKRERNQRRSTAKLRTAPPGGTLYISRGLSGLWLGPPDGMDLREEESPVAKRQDDMGRRHRSRETA
ncbi:hypothetical protein BU23DRAFT_64654 [Bimuria novae-zelandiae CBS 107.79]|uniref:Uncharacterized protein n=1 Tax=Bimuria novae-zelandiae CBS 107.79 TaxID=1447943 RepID=A0A6A5UK21_9PLEO|nr:hypothetical protein BU23DRAFT_64654 [Bimuria novae-zelandiae CBS 107.79]